VTSVLTNALATFSRSGHSVAEPSYYVIVNGDRLLATAELGKRDTLVDERPSDVFEQRQFSRSAEPTLATSSRSGNSVAAPNRPTTSS
jgi:hypothetical protein